MTNPSHLKVRYLFELPELPPGEVENSWTYTYVPNGPDKDYKVFLPTLIAEAVDDVSADILQAAAEYTDQETDNIRQDLLSTADSLGSDMVGYKLPDGDSVNRLLRDKLGDVVSAKDFGVVGDGSDESDKLQAAIDYAAASGGGLVLLPEGVFRARLLQARNNVILRGAGKNKTILRSLDGVDSTVIYNPGQNSGVPVEFFGIESLTIDGNKDGAAGNVATSAFSFSCFTQFYARNVRFQNASGYACAMQARGGGNQFGPQTYAYFEFCDFLDSGAGVGTSTYDGLDVKDCDWLTLVSCTASGNADDGFDVRGRSITMIACDANNNGNGGFAAGANNATPENETTVRYLGCEARNNLHGFTVTSGPTPTEAMTTSIIGCVSDGNTANGLIVPTNSQNVRLSAVGSRFSNNGEYGVRVTGAARMVNIVSCDVVDNGLSGIGTMSGDVVVSGGTLRGNSRYGLENLSAGGSRSVITGGTDLRDNTLAPVLQGSNNRTVVTDDCRYGNIGTDDIIPSAATLNLPPCGGYFVVTGTTNISSITGHWRGRQVTLQFGDVLTVTDGPGLALAGNFTTATGSTLTIVSNGSTWYEVSRSTN